MSYTTFRKIRQLENGDFRVVTKCSNDSAPPHEWTMDYFTITYPQFNHRQKEAALILSGLYSGDRYYPEKYKRLQNHAWDYSSLHFNQTGKYPYPLVQPCSRDIYERETQRMKKAEEDGGYIPEYWRSRTAYKNYEEYYDVAVREPFDFVNGFIAYVDSQEPIVKIKAKIKLNNNKWICKLTKNSRKISVSDYANEAKVFYMTKDEINFLLKRIPDYYNAEIIVIKNPV